MSDLAPVERRLSDALERIARRLEKGGAVQKPSRGAVFGLGARSDPGPDPEQEATIASLREALQAERRAEMAEMEEILAELKPLLAAEAR